MTDTTEERPVHHEFNCSAGEVTITPMTDEEWAAYKAQAVEHATEQAAQQAEDDALRAAVAAHADPVVKALAGKLGIQ